jgi:hypothetical protein
MEREKCVNASTGAPAAGAPRGGFFDSKGSARGAPDWGVTSEKKSTPTSWCRLENGAPVQTTGALRAVFRNQAVSKWLCGVDAARQARRRGGDLFSRT